MGSGPVIPPPVPLPARRPRRVVIVDLSDVARQVGARIRDARLARGMTQAELAGDRYTGAYISALERGLAKPSLASLVHLGARLDLPPAAFLLGIEIGTSGTSGRPATRTRAR